MPKRTKSTHPLARLRLACNFTREDAARIAGITAASIQNIEISRGRMSGWIAVIASAIAINPNLVAFLPEAIRNYVTGLAGIVAVVSGGTFAAQAKDKCVTGGTVQNDTTRSANDTPTRRITPLTVAALLPLFALSGCAWVQTHRTQIDDTLAVVGQRALSVAERVLISVATDEADKNFKADFLDSVATGLRQNETTIVNSDDVSKIVQIWKKKGFLLARWLFAAAATGDHGLRRGGVVRAGGGAAQGTLSNRRAAIGHP